MPTSNVALQAGIALSSMALVVANVRAQEDPAVFFAGKTVRIVAGVPVGSGADVTARVIARHIGNHIPGKPQVVVQSQPGADSLTMTHALYAAGPKDGTAIGAGSSSLPTAPLLSPDKARFDATRLNWVGSTSRDVQVTYSWHTVPIRTIDDIRARKFVVGSHAPGSTQSEFPLALNRLFGCNFSVVNGYEGTARIHHAMEKGEVHGVAAVNWSTVNSLIPQWLAERKVNIVAQFALRPHKDLARVPLWLDIAKTDAERQALELLLSRLEAGRPYFLPPETPAARIQAIRRAFDATMKDPAFLEEAEKSRLEIDPMTGEEVSALVARLSTTPPEMVARVRDAMLER